ncbi:MAG: terminase large subunit [Janthinobacterium lividum]
MPEWSTACLDWSDRIRQGRSIIPPPIFPAQAEEALAVFRALKIVDAPGSPTFGESCAPWVFDLVASIFGAYDAESGRRLITEWFVLIPKKNSKSTIAAGIMMTALILNWRASGEFTVIAPTIEVAGNAFSPARDMVEKDEDLDALMQVQRHVKTITHRETNATLKVVAADSNTVSGKKSIGTLVEELWLFGKQANAAAMFREAIGGLASRPEGFVIYVTTQSDDPPAGVFKEKLDYARGVRDGKIIDPGFVPIIFEHPDDMVASKENLLAKNLAMVNPNIGYSVDRAFLDREYGKAQIGGEAKLREFLAKHANVEIGMNLRSDRWTGADFWERQAVPAFTLAELLQRSEVVTVGIDGGGLDDLLGLAVVGRERETGKWLLWVHAWAHPVAIERRRGEESKYRDFEKDGDLTIIEALPGDVAQVATVVAQIYDSGKLASVGIDPEKTHKVMFQSLIDSGIPEALCFQIPQGWKLVGAISVAERRLAEGILIHGGQALMAWAVSNARVVASGNAILITKQVSGSAKIDPLMATFNAVLLMSMNPEAAGNYAQALADPIKIMRRPRQ